MFRTEFSKPPYNKKWSPKKSIEKIKILKNFYDCYTIFYENKIVGLVAVNPIFMMPGKVAFGENIVIKKEFQGLGIGTRVLERISDIYRKKGFKYFMGIVHKRSKSLKIYKRKGFKIDKDYVLIEKKLK